MRGFRPYSGVFNRRLARWNMGPSPSVPPARNGTQLRINELPPGACSPMHRTQTVDYGIDGAFTQGLRDTLGAEVPGSA